MAQNLWWVAEHRRHPCRRISQESVGYHEMSYAGSSSAVFFRTIKGVLLGLYGPSNLTDTLNRQAHLQTKSMILMIQVLLRPQPRVCTVSHRGSGAQPTLSKAGQTAPKHVLWNMWEMSNCLQLWQVLITHQWLPSCPFPIDVVLTLSSWIMPNCIFLAWRADGWQMSISTWIRRAGLWAVHKGLVQHRGYARCVACIISVGASQDCHFLHVEVWSHGFIIQVDGMLWQAHQDRSLASRWLSVSNLSECVIKFNGLSQRVRSV